MAKGHTIQAFKSTLVGGGARPNLFEVKFQNTLPGGVGLDNEKMSMLCKAASLPASNIAPIEVPFRGRIFKVAGDRTFDTWSLTVINDIDFSIRNSMEAWMQHIGQHADASGATNPGDYQIDADVVQYSRVPSNLSSIEGTGDQEMKVAKAYKFYGIFPTNISAIDLSYDTGDTIEEFTVEFQVQYWGVSTGEQEKA